MYRLLEEERFKTLAQKLSVIIQQNKTTNSLSYFDGLLLWII